MGPFWASWNSGGPRCGPPGLTGAGCLGTAPLPCWSHPLPHLITWVLRALGGLSWGGQVPQTAVTMSPVTPWPSRSQQSAACANGQLRHLLPLPVQSRGSQDPSSTAEPPAAPLLQESCSVSAGAGEGPRHPNLRFELVKPSCGPRGQREWKSWTGVGVGPWAGGWPPGPALLQRRANRHPAGLTSGTVCL